MRVSVASWVPTGILPAMHRSARWLPGSLAGVIALWQLVCSIFGVSEFIFPSPARIWEQMVEFRSEILRHS